MGGDGSGRRPDVLKMAREQFQNKQVEFEEVPLVIPNYSGIQKSALNQSGLTAGSVIFVGADGKFTEDNANWFWDNTNNRLGIGTTSPGSNLEVNSAGNTEILVHSTPADGNPTLAIQNDARKWVFKVAGTVSDSLIIRDVSAGADRVTIDTNGDFGIGTTAPGAPLDVYGESYFGGVAAGSAQFVRSVTGGNLTLAQAGGQLAFGSRVTASPGTTYQGAQIKGSAAENWNVGVAQGMDLVFSTVLAGTTTLTTSMIIQDDGKVGIGTTNPTNKLEVSGGSIAISGGTGGVFRMSTSGGVQANVTSGDLVGKTMNFSGGILVGYS